MADANAVLTHQSFDALPTRREASCPKFAHHSRTAVGASDLGMAGSNQRQPLGIGQSLAIRPTTALPSAITADADIKYIAHFYERIAQALFGNPGVLQRRSLAKYAVAFLGFRSPA